MTIGPDEYESGRSQDSAGDLHPTQEDFDRRVSSLVAEAQAALEHGLIEEHTRLLVAIEELFLNWPAQAAAFVEGQPGEWEDYIDGETIQRATG